LRVFLALALALVVASALRPRFESADGTMQVDNPIGVDAFAAIGSFAFEGGQAIVLLLGVLALAASLTVRVRRGDALVRRQLAWLGYPVALCLAILLAGALARAFGSPVWDLLIQSPLLFVLVNVGLPTAIVVAVTRYRLYELDRIVSRTVTYGLLTAGLVATYIGSVMVLRTALTSLAADSDLAVAGSTLVVAALFGPVRRRIQAVVDRRFNRARYDAANAVESFGQRLRDEVDLDEVTAELCAAVATTVQPVAAFVWLPEREEADR
jgi:hypothetical protein